MDPIVLGPNQPEHFYRGGRNIAELRGIEPSDANRPEDWVASITTRFGSDTIGATVLPDGRTLAAAVDAEPERWLGRDHAERWGATTALLVKLLDAAQRLPVHCHPSRAFARDHLASPFGKTEAWVIVRTPGTEGHVHLGFREDVDAERLHDWVARQGRDALLAATNRVPVRPGDAVFVPAGTPHCTEAGVFLVELQEPTDYSVLLEWEGFLPYESDGAHLRLGWELALECVDRRALDSDAIAGLIRARDAMPEPRPGVRTVFPAAADPYFQGELVRPRPSATLDASFAVLVVLDGAGELRCEHGGTLPLRRGATVLVPFAAGAGVVSGEVEVLRCLPPRTR